MSTHSGHTHRPSIIRSSSVTQLSYPGSHYSASPLSRSHRESSDSRGRHVSNATGISYVPDVTGYTVGHESWNPATNPRASSQAYPRSITGSSATPTLRTNHRSIAGSLSNFSSRSHVYPASIASSSSARSRSPSPSRSTSPDERHATGTQPSTYTQSLASVDEKSLRQQVLDWGHIHDKIDRHQYKNIQLNVDPNSTEPILPDSERNYRHGGHVLVRRRFVGVGQVYYSNFVPGRIIRPYECCHQHTRRGARCYLVLFDKPSHRRPSEIKQSVGIFSSVNEIRTNDRIVRFKDCGTLRVTIASNENKVRENSLGFAPFSTRKDDRIFMPIVCIKRARNSDGRLGYMFHVRLNAGKYRDMEYLTDESEILPYNIETVEAMRAKGSLRGISTAVSFRLPSRQLVRTQTAPEPQGRSNILLPSNVTFK